MSPATPASQHEPSDAPAFDRGALERSLLTALKRRVAVVVRVSSPGQIRNTGSIAAQRLQQRFVDSFGVPTERVDVFEMLGESATEGAYRPNFDRLVDAINGGQVGLLVTQFADRLARNDLDSARLFTAMRKHGTLLLANGVIYDPKDPNEQLVLHMLAAIAAHDNAIRRVRSLMAKAAKAARHELAFRLPAGLDWFAPDDPQYADAMRRAGLGDWLDAIVAAKWPHSRKGEKTRYPLPVPDRDVVAACVLRMRYLEEAEGDLGRVLERIRDPNNPDWPEAHRGEVPVLAKTRLGAHEVAPLLADGRPAVGGRSVVWEEATRKHLAKFFTRPAYYGIYAVTIKALQEAQDRGAPDMGLRPKVWVEDAFKGFAPSAAYTRNRFWVEECPTAERPKGSVVRARNHAFPLVRCSAIHPVSGRPCDARLSPVHVDRRGLVYMSSKSCPHRLRVSHKIEEPVLDLIAACLDRARLAGEFEALEVADRDHQREISAQEQRLASIDRQLRTLQELILQLLSEGDPATEPEIRRQDAKQWEEKRRELLVERHRCEQQIERAKHARASLADVTKRELGRVFALAQDFPEHVRRLRAIERETDAQVQAASTDEDRRGLRAREGLVRKLLAHLVRCVRVTAVARATYDVEVEFRSGARAAVLVATAGVDATQPERAYAAWRHDLGADPEEIARELGRLSGEPAWSAERVRTAVAAAAHFDPPIAGEDLVPVKELAREVGVSEAELSRLVLKGRLGDAGIRGGEFAVVRDEGALEANLPDYARRQVAARSGWGVDDTRTVVELAKYRGVTRDTIVKWAKHGAGVREDRSGRCYARLSDVDRPVDRLAPLLAAASADVRALPRQYWVSYLDIDKAIARDRPTMDRHIPRVPEQRTEDVKLTFYWLDPAGEVRLWYPKLPELVRAIPGGRLCEMIPVRMLRARLAEAGFGHAEGEIARAAERAGVPVVTTSRGREPAAFVQVPVEIWHASDNAALPAWFRKLLEQTSRESGDRAVAPNIGAARAWAGDE